MLIVIQYEILEILTGIDLNIHLFYCLYLYNYIHKYNCFIICSKHVLYRPIARNCNWGLFLYKLQTISPKFEHFNQFVAFSYKTVLVKRGASAPRAPPGNQPVIIDISFHQMLTVTSIPLIIPTPDISFLKSF